MAGPPIDPSAPALDPDDEGWDVWNPWLARERDTVDDEDAEASVMAIDLTANLDSIARDGPRRSERESSERETD